MSVRYFAVSIDGTDWSEHILRVALSRSRTTRPVQESGSSVPRRAALIAAKRHGESLASNAASTAANIHSSRSWWTVSCDATRFDLDIAARYIDESVLSRLPSSPVFTA